MGESTLLKDLLEFTRDGEWGKADPDDDLVEMAIIRGTDFSAIRQGDVSSVPRRFIPKNAAVRKTLRPGDILIETAGGTKDQPTGRTVHLSEGIFDAFPVPVTCASFSRFLRVNREIVTPEYLFWHLQWIYMIGETLPYHIQHTGVARFQYTDFASQWRVPLPSPEEQAAISDTLSPLDIKVALNQRMNRTLEATARAIFRDWFVDFGPTRAKAEGRAPYLTSDLWNLFPEGVDEENVPVGWRIGTVSDFFELTMGQSPPGSTYNESENGIPFFQGRTDFGFRYPENRKYCTAPTRFADVDDTLVSVRAPVGDINMAWERCCVGRGVAGLRHRSGSRSYTYYSAWRTQRELKAFEHTGTVFGSINKKQFRALSVVEPTGAMISAFETLIWPFDQRIRMNVSESRALVQTRNYLLPRLMSGEIRLREAEKAVQAAT